MDWIIDCDRAEAQLDDLDRDYGRCSLMEIGTMAKNWVTAEGGVLLGAGNIAKRYRFLLLLYAAVLSAFLIGIVLGIRNVG